MPYESQSAMIAKEEKKPVLIDLNSRFDKALSHQRELQEGIIDKLHQVLNKRGPEKDAVRDQPPTNDFISTMSWKLRILEELNDKWVGVLSHISEIV